MGGFDRQVPDRGEVYLDHVGWFIPNVEKASAAFERLGFVLTPFVVSRNADPAGGPPRPSGTGNRCAMLRRGYLELIARIEGVDTPLARQHAAALERYVGVHVVAFTVADASAAHVHLKREGFQPGDPVLLRRPIQTESGSEVLAQFSVVRVAPEMMPEGRIQVLTQETPELIWQPRLVARENGITALSGALICTPDPAEAAERYGRFVGRQPAGAGDYSTLQLDRGRLGFATPDRCRSLLSEAPRSASAHIAAVGMVADDTRAASRFLRGRGIALREGEGRSFQISSADAMGAVVVVHQAGEGWPE